VVYVGYTVVISCESYTTPYWTHSNKNMSNSSMLIIYNASGYDMGEYHCHGSFLNQTEFKASSVLLVGGNLSIF